MAEGVTEPNYQGPGIYRHYKGGLYAVLMVIVDEESKEAEGNFVSRVVYVPLSPGSLLEEREETGWGRKLDDFNAEVIIGGIEDTSREVIPRFQKIA